jgi:transcriptional regulator with PAS, ATPase and Fis domain
LIAALEDADRIAATDIPVLLVGETGTGKELFARYLHERSGRRGSLACVDCGALPDELVESILFGHDRGAFTHALAASEGIIAEAEGGTLLLDELSSLPLKGQAKLLRVLETGYVRRVGSSAPRSMHFRLVATVQPNIADMLRAGAFRDDLLQRVGGAIIELPRLADRGGDAVLLARHFAATNGCHIADDVQDALEEYDWPGNVRELRWTIARAVLFAPEGLIDRSVLLRSIWTGPATLRASRQRLDTDSSSRAVRLRSACELYAGDPELIARSFGIGRSTLYRWLKEDGIALATFRSSDDADSGGSPSQSHEMGQDGDGRSNWICS